MLDGGMYYLFNCTDCSANSQEHILIVLFCYLMERLQLFLVCMQKVVHFETLLGNEEVIMHSKLKTN